jgi:probable HAF family extracellular repeat protein
MYTMVVIATLGFLLTLPPIAWPQITKDYTIKQITYKGSVNTSVSGINDRPGVYGDVLFGIANEDGSGSHFVKMGGKYVELPPLDDTEHVGSLNYDRVVVGTGICADIDGDVCGFIVTGVGRRNTQIHTVQFPGMNTTWAEGINDAGTVVGTYDNADEFGTRSFIFHDGAYTSLTPLEGWDVYASDVNNQGQITGTAYDGNTGITYGFLYEDGEYQFFALPESTYAWPTGINDHGHIVGNYWVDEPSEMHENCCWKGFLFKNSTFTTINITQNAQTRVAGINNAGQIAGTFYRPDGDGSGRGFVAIPKPPPKPKKPAKVAPRS